MACCCKSWRCSQTRGSGASEIYAAADVQVLQVVCSQTLRTGSLPLPPARRSPSPPPPCHRQQVALVCKRFATLASTPQLLREVDLGSISPSLEVLHSLTAWLGQHGRHMRTVSIALSDGNYEPTAVASCLAAAGTAGQQLQQLSVDGCNWGTEWLATMRSLRSCKLEASYNRALHISASVSMLTALENLSLSGCPITFAEGSSLPPSITRLDLADGGHDVPLQASWLGTRAPFGADVQRMALWPNRAISARLGLYLDGHELTKPRRC